MAPQVKTDGQTSWHHRSSQSDIHATIYNHFHGTRIIISSLKIWAPQINTENDIL